MKEGQTIYSVLSADGDVSALVSTRIYPEGSVPQNPTLPYISYIRLSGNPTVTLTDYGNTEQILLQLDCWSDDFAEAEDLATKTRTALFGGLNIGGINDITIYEPEVFLYRVMFTISLWL